MHPNWQSQWRPSRVCKSILEPSAELRLTNPTFLLVQKGGKKDTPVEIELNQMGLIPI